jgi:hypothetical protein
MNFEELLIALREADEAMEGELDLSIIDDIKGKVDSIRYISKKLEAEINGITEELKSLQKRKATLTKNQELFEQRVINAMINQNAPMVPGESWTLSLVENPEKVVVKRPAEDRDWLDNPDAVRMKVEYTWNKAFLKNNIEVFSSIATVERGHRIKFVRAET